VDVVHEAFAHFLGPQSAPTAIKKYLLPGAQAINFVLPHVLGGGGTASLRSDPQGKGYAQILLATPITIARDIFEAGS
ncbi:MAG: terpene utilization protein AtuA, partial [Pseudomonadota bacterium]